MNVNAVRKYFRLRPEAYAALVRLTKEHQAVTQSATMRAIIETEYEALVNV